MCIDGFILDFHQIVRALISASELTELTTPKRQFAPHDIELD